MSAMTLYHTGFERIEVPDVRAGRSNADFGQGFYLSGDLEFSRRWARSRRGEDTWLNAYELDLDGLEVARFERDGAWFDYIFANRAGRRDALAGRDVIIGPIANDTLYDTWGISTSGLLGREQSLRLLQIGPVYGQVAVKTDRAAARLRLVRAEILPPEQLAAWRETVRREEAEFQRQFGEALEEMGK